MYFMVLLFAVPAILLLFLVIQRGSENGRKAAQPPGPPGLPIIGNLHQCFPSCLHVHFHQLSTKYGPLVSLKFGSRPILVVSSATMAKQVLKTYDHVFSSRPKFANQQKLTYNGLSMALAPYGDYWRAVRKICAVHLLSPTKVHSFSPIREKEVCRTTQKISRLSADNRMVNLSEMAMHLSNTVICRTAFGRRSEDDSDSDDNDAYTSSFQGLLKEVQELAVGFCFADYFPYMGWADKLTGSSAKLHKVFMELDGLLEEIIDEHVNAVRPKSGVEDTVDVLLRLQKERSSIGFDITRDHIKAVLLDLFAAGTDTSAATVVFAMTELMRNPEAMKRVQEEARNSTGGKNTSMMKEEDVGKLVYLKAVVKETMRLHPVGPLLLPREATQKCCIEGYEIQEKTLVFVNAWAIGRDPESWENPEEFRPERFVCDEPVDFRGQDFELIPFGAGRRICPGMHMGMAMVELALANLVWSFDWTVPVGMEEEILDTSVLPGITSHKKTPLCLLAKKYCGC